MFCTKRHYYDIWAGGVFVSMMYMYVIKFNCLISISVSIKPDHENPHCSLHVCYIITLPPQTDQKLNMNTLIVDEDCEA